MLYEYQTDRCGTEEPPYFFCQKWTQESFKRKGVFPFLKLPGEIRQMVYDQYIGTESGSMTLDGFYEHGALSTGSRGQSIPGNIFKASRKQRKWLAELICEEYRYSTDCYCMFLCNRQVLEEGACSLLHKRGTYVNSGGEFLRLVHFTQSFRCADVVTKLSLELDTFNELCVVPVSHALEYLRQGALRKAFPNLVELELVFTTSFFRTREGMGFDMHANSRADIDDQNPHSFWGIVRTLGQELSEYRGTGHRKSPQVTVTGLASKAAENIMSRELSKGLLELSDEELWIVNREKDDDR